MSELGLGLFLLQWLRGWSLFYTVVRADEVDNVFSIASSADVLLWIMRYEDSLLRFVFVW
jgi:hypothetical protein